MSESILGQPDPLGIALRGGPDPATETAWHGGCTRRIESPANLGAACGTGTFSRGFYTPLPAPHRTQKFPLGLDFARAIEGATPSRAEMVPQKEMTEKMKCRAPGTSRRVPHTSVPQERCRYGPLFRFRIALSRRASSVLRSLDFRPLPASGGSVGRHWGRCWTVGARVWQGSPRGKNNCWRPSGPPRRWERAQSWGAVRNAKQKKTSGDVLRDRPGAQCVVRNGRAGGGDRAQASMALLAAAIRRPAQVQAHSPLQMCKAYDTRRYVRRRSPRVPANTPALTRHRSLPATPQPLRPPKSSQGRQRSDGEPVLTQGRAGDGGMGRGSRGDRARSRHGPLCGGCRGCQGVWGGCRRGPWHTHGAGPEKRTTPRC